MPKEKLIQVCMGKSFAEIKAVYAIIGDVLALLREDKVEEAKLVLHHLHSTLYGNIPDWHKK